MSQESQVLSDKEWEEYIDGLIAAHKEGRCNPKTCAQCLLEYYPSFTKDYWECRRCGRAQVFNHDDPPVRIKTAICNLGHVHIINGK